MAVVCAVRRRRADVLVLVRRSVSEIDPGDWPGSRAAYLVDFLNVSQQHDCNAPPSGDVNARSTVG